MAVSGFRFEVCGLRGWGFWGWGAGFFGTWGEGEVVESSSEDQTQLSVIEVFSSGSGLYWGTSCPHSLRRASQFKAELAAGRAQLRALMI